MTHGRSRRGHGGAVSKAGGVALAALAVLAAGLLPAPGAPEALAAPLEVSAAWVHADVGLDGNGDGPSLGVGTQLPLGDRPWDLLCALEYLQLKGTQPTTFTTSTNPHFTDDADVTLHLVQPVVLLASRALPPAWPQPYAGLSVALKVGEIWGDFPGVPSSEWGYEDLDFVGHLGLTRRLGPVRLDLRYSHGLTDQLLADPDTGNPLKAEDPLPGVETPTVGTHLSHWRFGAAWAF